MDEITTIFGSLSRLLAIVGGGISTVAVCYAGILWMTSSGDPQNMSKARMALMGAVGGLIIVGVAFIVPRIIGETVVEPVGGNIGGSDAGQNCDDVLQNQFVFQRNASTTEALNAVISVIQNQRVDQCSVDVWNPTVVDAGPAVVGPPVIPEHECHDQTKIGVQDVPSGLQHVTSASNVDEDTDEPESTGTGSGVRDNSGRDRDNNVIIHWDHKEKPTDDTNCWMYVSRLSTWSVE